VFYNVDEVLGGGIIDSAEIGVKPTNPGDESPLLRYEGPREL
jgi:hypothetical protein